MIEVLDTFKIGLLPDLQIVNEELCWTDSPVNQPYLVIIIIKKQPLKLFGYCSKHNSK